MAKNRPLAYYVIRHDTPEVNSPYKKHSTYNGKSARLYGPQGEELCHVAMLTTLDGSVTVVYISQVFLNGGV